MMDLLRRLHKAVKEGDKAGVERAVASGADMDIVWGMEGTALCNAISSGCLDMILLLLELGCNINAPDFDGGSPLSLAIRKHQVDVCFILLSNPLCDVNQLDPVTKRSPLCLAVVENVTPVVEALVQDSRCRYVEDLDPALHLSLQCKHYPITSVLSRCDALRMLRNAAGLAPVHIVAQLGDLEAFELLYPTDCRRDEIYHQTGEHGEGHTVCGGTASASILSKELNQRCTLTGDTSLHLAVRGVHVNIVKSLLRLGADVNLQNNAGQTALLLACAQGHRDLALMLLQAGASPNLTGFLRVQQRTLLSSHARESTLTPLHVAAASGDQPLAAMLCEYGADVNACDERGRSPLYLALINSSSEVALYLVKSAKSTLKTHVSQILRGNMLLHAACHCFSHTSELAEQLIELGCSVNAPDSMGNLPLHDAISFENVDMVATLLSKGASPSCRGADGCLPLRMAAMTGRVDIARLLVSAGASLEGSEGLEQLAQEEREDEQSPLKEALESCMVDFARFLVEAGCDLSSQSYLFNCKTCSQETRVLDISDDSSEDETEEENDDMPDIVQEDPDLVAWLQMHAWNPKTLMQLCLDAVRFLFRTGGRQFSQMTALPLPEKIIAKLFYKTD